jgi:Aspartyl protease
MILLDAEINHKPAVLLLDTGANNSIVSAQAAGMKAKLEALRPTGTTGAEGAYIKGNVDLGLASRTFLSREVLIMDLSDASRRMGTKIDGFLGMDILCVRSGFTGSRSRNPVRNSSHRNSMTPWPRTAPICSCGQCSL